MSSRADAEPKPAVSLEAEAGGRDAASAEAPASQRRYPSLDEIVELSAAAQAASQRASAVAPAALRVARVVEVDGRHATLAWRGAASGKVAAEIAPEVEVEVVRRAVEDREAVLVEVVEGAAPVVVAVLCTRTPREVHIRAETIHLEADRELTLRSGRAAVRLREDGDVEIVGSRISAASRGLFRLVGRILRLN